MLCLSIRRVNETCPFADGRQKEVTRGQRVVEAVKQKRTKP